MGPYEAVTHVEKALRAAGIRATADRRDLTAPGVWVYVDSVSEGHLCGDRETVVAVCAVARDNGDRAAVSQLDHLSEKIAETLDVDGAFQAATFNNPHGGPLPCFTANLLPL